MTVSSSNPTLAQQVIDGAMLSDANLRGDRKNSSLYINQSGTQHIDWLNSIKDALTSLRIHVGSQYPKIAPRISSLTGKRYDYCYLVSHTHSLLTLQRNRWYPKGTKIVPQDLVLTPAALAHWFMGDGSSSWMKKNPNLGVASFSTEKFDEDSITTLELQLAHLGIFASRGHRTGKPWITLVIGSVGSICRLMDLVEPYTVPSYRYKIKKPYYLKGGK